VSSQQQKTKLKEPSLKEASPRKPKGSLQQDLLGRTIILIGACGFEFYDPNFYCDLSCLKERECVFKKLEVGV